MYLLSVQLQLVMYCSPPWYVGIFLMGLVDGSEWKLWARCCLSFSGYYTWMCSSTRRAWNMLEESEAHPRRLMIWNAAISIQSISWIVWNPPVDMRRIGPWRHRIHFCWRQYLGLSWWIGFLIEISLPQFSLVTWDAHLSIDQPPMRIINRYWIHTPRRYAGGKILTTQPDCVASSSWQTGFAV